MLDLSKVVICRKYSILEYDQKRFGLSETEVIEKYQKMGAGVERIVESHKRQLANFEKIKKYFPDSPLYHGETLTPEVFKNVKLVIIFGGDNYFQYVSHFLTHQLVVGINADPETSEGKLLNFKTEEITDLVGKLENGEYQTEQWTRLEASVNGQKIIWPAISEIFFGASSRLAMSRYIIEIGGNTEEHKDSGLLVATGSGSTGWYKSASSCLHTEDKGFNKTEKVAKFISTETFYGKLSQRNLTCGEIKPGQKIVLGWLGHEKGILAIDSCMKYDLGFEFDRGGQATIEISQNPLLVISS